jgi:hypothetical protein
MCPAQLCALPGAVSRGSAAAGGAAANIPAIIAPAANHTLVCVIFRYPCPGSAPSILPLAGSKANTGMSLRRSLRAAPSHFCEPSSIIEFLFDTLEMSTTDQLLYSALRGMAWRYATERRNPRRIHRGASPLADGRNRITVGSWHSWPRPHSGSLIGPGGGVR